MLANERKTNAKAEPSAAAGPFGGVKRIKKFGHGFRRDSDAIVLDRDDHTATGHRETDLDTAGIANFPNSLFGIGNKIEKDLNQLIGIADDRRQIGTRSEVNLDLIAAKRMFVKLQSPFNDGSEINAFLLRRGWTGKLQQILHDAGGAASLTVREVQLALHGIVKAFALADQFGNAQNRGQRIIQFVRDSSQHLAHGGKFFGLDELFFEAFEVGNVAARKNDTFNFVVFIKQRTEVEENAAPFGLFIANAQFQGCKTLPTTNDVLVKGRYSGQIFGMR